MAIEVKYHKACYGSYTRNVKKLELEGATRYDGNETAFTHIWRCGWEGLWYHEDHRAVGHLLRHAERGWLICPELPHWKPQGQTQKHYDDRLSFWQPHNKTETEIIFSKAVSTGQAVEAVAVATEMTNVPLPPPVEETTP